MSGERTCHFLTLCRVFLIGCTLLSTTNAQATPAELDSLLQQAIDSWYQVEIFPDDPAQPMEFSTALDEDYVKVTNGTLLATDSEKIRIQVSSENPARLSITGGTLAGLHDFANTTRLRFRLDRAKNCDIENRQSELDHYRGDDAILNNSAALCCLKEIARQQILSELLPVEIDPTPVFVFANSTTLSSASSTVNTGQTTVTVSPPPIATSLPAATSEPTACPQSLTDIAGLCGLFLQMSHTGCCESICSYAGASAGCVTGIVLGIILTVITGRGFYIGVGAGAAVALTFAGFYLGKLGDAIRRQCTTENKHHSPVTAPPRHSGPSAARIIANMGEDADGEELCADANAPDGGGIPPVSETVITVEMEPVPASNEQQEEEEAEDSEKNHDPEGSGHQETDA